MELFPAAILLLCPYSVQAILPSLFICGIDAYLLAYECGYCKDYKEWRLADLGSIEDMTKLSEESSEKLLPSPSTARATSSFPYKNPTPRSSEKDMLIRWPSPGW